MSLDGRVAVVTGATKGVGRGIGRELARHGARVFGTGRSAPHLGRLDEQITGIRCDHRLDREVEAAFDVIVQEGKAIDIRVPGVALTRLRDAALAIGVGGVGYYPTSDFVHVDVGRPRRWSGA